MAQKSELIVKIGADAKKFNSELKRVADKTQDLEDNIAAATKASAAAFVAFSGSIGLSLKAFSDFERALVGVGKTTGIQGQELEKFGDRIQKLSKDIPVSTKELLNIAQTAGQLGVTGADNLEKFTDTVAKLGFATDLTGEQAATSLTRIINVTGESIENIDTLGSVVVALGNSFAATESEIVRVANEVARATTEFDLGSAGAAAFGAALRSAGVRAELGGSAIGRTFRALDKALREGGKSLSAIEDITGKTGDEFRRIFEKDSKQAFSVFIQGLGNVIESGGSSAQTLERLGLKGEEILKVLPPLAQNSDLLTNALKTSAKETENATALNEEAKEAFDTLNASFVTARNSLVNFATNIGTKFAPAARAVLEAITSIVGGISSMGDGFQTTIAVVLGLGAAMTGLATTAGVTSIAILKLRTASAAMNTVFGFGIKQIFTMNGLLPKLVTGIGTTITAFKGLSLAMKILVGSTGIGLLLVGLSTLIFNWEKTWNAIKAITKGVVDAVVGYFKGLFKVYEGLFTLDFDKAKEGFNDIKDAAVKSFDETVDKIQQKADESDVNVDVQTQVKSQIPLSAASKKSVKDSVAEIEKLAKGRDVNIPLKAQGPALPGLKPDASATRKAETQKTEVVDAETQKRIERARQELEVVRREREGASEAEIRILKEKNRIKREIEKAELIKNDELRRLELEKLRAQQEQVLEQEREFRQRKREEEQIAREERKILEEERKVLNEEEEARLRQKDIEELRSQAQTQKEIERELAKEKLKNQIETNNDFLKNQKKFGTTYAKINRAINRSEVQGAAQAANQLVKLQNSKSETLQGIGKAAALTQQAISTAQGAIAAYASLAPIPIVGPALGAAAAAALIAYGLEQKQKILQANQGGRVPTNLGIPGRDSVPANLTPGEGIVPEENFDETIGSVRAKREAEKQNGGSFQGTNNPKMLRKLDEISRKLDRFQFGNINVEGDFIGEEQFTDRMIEQINDRIEFGNAELRPEGSS